MKKSKIRIGLIGCGTYMWWAHVPHLLKEKHAVIAAVSDPQQSQIDILLEKAGGLKCPAYSDYKEMILRENLDGVFISTPHSLHYEQAKFALENNVHVLVQKPFTIRIDHAVKLMALAEKKSRFIMVSYQRFFEGISVYAKELIEKGQIGDIRAVACRITQSWGNVKGWRGEPEFSGGGFMMDTGSHLVSAMLRVTGLKPVQVTAITENYDKKVDLASGVLLRFNNGAIGTMSFFGNAARFEESVVVHGTKGYLILKNCQTKPKKLIVNDEELTVPAKYKPASPDSTFIGWIRTGGKGYTPPHTGLDTIKLSDAIYRAARAGKAVRLKL